MRRLVLTCVLCDLLWSCGSAPSNSLFVDGVLNTGGESAGVFPSAGGASSASGGALFVSGGASSSAGAFTAGGASAMGGTQGDGGGPGNGGTSAGGGGLDAGGGEGSGGWPSDASVDAGDDAALGRCPRGDYGGVLTGRYRSSSGTNPIAVDIAFTIDAHGKAAGTFTGQGDNLARAELAGAIDCATGVLTLTIEKGTYPTANGRVTFRGTLTATYDETEHFPDGVWKMTEPASSNGGQGVWSAR